MLVHITKSRKYAQGEYEGSPKTETSIRDVTLTATALKNLLDWKKELTTKLFALGIHLSDDDYIFRSMQDVTKPMLLSYITNSFRTLRERLKLPMNLRFHSFRHTHATLLAEHEVSAKKIQVRLGHASASFTMDRYIHNTEHMQDGVTNMIERISEKYGR